jgi:branched-chain amino acid transport system substrate-binding protein
MPTRAGPKRLTERLDRRFKVWRRARAGGTLAPTGRVIPEGKKEDLVRKLIVVGAALVAALALTVPGAIGGPEQTPGVTARSITLGGTFPLTGPAATYAPIPLGIKAYFAYTNARKGPDGKRGVGGRQIIWKYYDDGYNPVQTAQLTRRLVEEDRVFATLGQLGTEPVEPTRGYINGRRVPQAFVSTGASQFVTQWKEFPWTTGWQPDYIAEGRVYGLHVKANHRGKKIGIVFQNDSYGRDYLYGFRAALGKAYADANVVASEPVETTATSVAAQLTRVRAAGAQILAVFQLPTPTVRTVATARALGINPDQIYLNSVAAVKPATDGMIASAGPQYVNGMITIGYFKDPQDPRWANDAAMREYRQIIERYGGGANANDPQVMYGVAKAESMVQVLRRAGKNPTRAGLMNAILSMNYPNRFLLPGTVQKTSRTDRFVISRVQLQRFNSEQRRWVPFGQPIEGRPR